MSKRSKRKPQRLSSYRDPVTGQSVVYGDDVDPEMQCLEAAALIEPARLARMRELTSQSQQNRARIIKRAFGDSGIPPVAR
jgi:hypothetical protein